MDTKSEHVPKKHSRRQILKGVSAVGAAAASLLLEKGKVSSTAKPQLQRRSVLPQLASGETQMAVQTAKPAQPETQPLIDISTFPWTENELLFGPGAGFEHARQGEPIKVWIDPKVKPKIDDSSFQAWNRLAKSVGRKNDLFIITEEKDGADINLLPSTLTYVDMFTPEGKHYKDAPKGKFGWVNIHCALSGQYEITNKMLLHELAHALGIPDALTEFMWTELQIRSNYVHPLQGYLSDKPLQSNINYHEEYNKRGVLGPDDGKVLKITRYA